MNIKLIDKNTDLSKISQLRWDAYLNDVQLKVYIVSDCFHSIGGKWGNNNYWCCERSEEPTYKTFLVL